VAALVNVLVMLPGRSGHMAAIAVLSLALLWALPRRWMLAGLLAPVVLVGLAMAVSPQFNKRLSMAVAETSAYKTQNDATTSSGQRLNFWRRSLQAIAAEPLYGHGVGSWNREYRRLENDNPSPVTAQVRNPHQEYLLWGVQLGVGGVLVFLAFLLALLRDARAFSPALRRATGSAVAVLAVACLFNSSLFDALIGEFFCIVLGLLLAFGRQERPAGPAS
jgi:O-antigen ligase